MALVRVSYPLTNVSGDVVGIGMMDTGVGSWNRTVPTATDLLEVYIYAYYLRLSDGQPVSIKLGLYVT